MKFCSAPCGSGKTHQIIERAAQFAAEGDFVVVLQPTKELINKTIERELLTRKNAPAHRAFYSVPGSSTSVSRQLTEHFQYPPDLGHIVFATHQVLPFIRFWANQSLWHVFVDEELQVVKHGCFRLPQTHKIITKSFELEPHNSIYSRLVVTDDERLSKIAHNEDKDEIYGRFCETAQLLINENWELFVNTEQFHKLKDGGGTELSIHSILSPEILSGFASVTMASANFPDSLIYKLWRNEGIEFKENSNLSQKLRFQEHSNGALITIKYATELPWSKTLQTRKAQLDDDDSGSVLDALIEIVKTEFQNHPFLWQANKSLATNPFLGEAQRLPNIPHGLNDYSKIDRICFLSALNPRNDHFRFLTSRGVRNDEVHKAIYCSAVYQSVMRTSIRDPQNLSPKTIIVPDRTAAEYLAKLFPGSNIEKLNTQISENATKLKGRPRKYSSNSERVAACRKRKQIKNLQDVVQETIVRPYTCGNVGCDVNDTSDEMSADESCNEMTIGVTGTFVTGLEQRVYGSIYATKNSNEPLYLYCENVELLIKALKLFHDRSVSRKDANHLISRPFLTPITLRPKVKQNAA